jgi:hypothetical protein
MIYPTYKRAMQDIQDIFAIWPSINDMAAALDEKPDTVLRWKYRGRIPESAWSNLIAKAAQRERLITAGELLALNAPMQRRGRPPKQAVSA